MTDRNSAGRSKPVSRRPHLGPPLYWRSVLLLTATLWLLARAAILVLALQARWPRPAALSPLAAILVVLIVVGLTWLDLRRRNLTVLLPVLGAPIPVLLGLSAITAAAAEMAVSLMLR